MENIVNTTYIAEAIDVTPAHVSLLIRRDKIKATKFGVHWMIDRAEADRFIEEYLANPPKTGPNAKKRSNA